MNYRPKKPVKSFRDLEVYQRAHAMSVTIVKNYIKPDELKVRALKLPVQIAMAHSLRFADYLRAVKIIEEALYNCNLIAVYLEQYRDIYSDSTDTESIKKTVIEVEGLIREYMTLRGKILRLQQSWERFQKDRV